MYIFLQKTVNILRLSKCQYLAEVDFWRVRLFGYTVPTACMSHIQTFIVTNSQRKLAKSLVFTIILKLSFTLIRPF